MANPKSSIAAAVDENYVLGRKGQSGLLWRQKKDLENLAKLARGKIIVCGKETLSSLIVNDSAVLRAAARAVFLSKNASIFPDFYHVSIEQTNSFDEALLSAGDEEVIVLGGPRVYKEALSYANTQTIYLTIVHVKIWGDLHFPKFNRDEWRIISSVRHKRDSENDFDFTFRTLVRKSR